MKAKTPVIVVTDGDKRAFFAVREASRRVGLTPIFGASPDKTRDLDEVLKDMAEVDGPVVLTVDDHGNPGQGPGEKLLLAVADNPSIHLLGIVAVASRTAGRTAFVTRSVDHKGRLVAGAVDKQGQSTGAFELRSDVGLQGWDVPVVGVGDPGRGEGAINALEEALRAILAGVHKSLRPDLPKP